MAKEIAALAAQLNVQTKGEFGAIIDYETLLSQFSHVLDDEDITIIKEVIGDEKNHALKFQAMARKYDGGIKPANDDLCKAIKAITEGTDCCKTI
jgi:rubrerythrin